MSRSRHSPKQRQCNRWCTICWPDGSYKLAKAPTPDLYETEPYSWEHPEVLGQEPIDDDCLDHDQGDDPPPPPLTHRLPVEYAPRTLWDHIRGVKWTWVKR